jgi:3-hydroxyacyl-CoA dehydrogenase
MPWKTVLCSQSLPERSQRGKRCSNLSRFNSPLPILTCLLQSLIINRLWAAVKRETLQILAEGVSEPKEIDLLWQNMFLNCAPPCRLMDEIGLDTVALIEDHYIHERHLDGRMTVDWLRENYVSKGLLGNKSGSGGLYSARVQGQDGESEDA